MTKCKISFYAKIEDGRQKWWEKFLCEKLPTDCRYPCRCPRGKNFVKIALSHTIPKINAFLHFTQKFKIAAKNGGKTILGKSH